MSVLRKVRRARRSHVCLHDGSWAADHRINPGDLYVEVKATPDDREVGTGRWQRGAVCAACAKAKVYDHEITEALSEVGQ